MTPKILAVMNNAGKLDRESLQALGNAFKKADRNMRRLRGRDSQLPDGEVGHSRFELLDLLRETQPTSPTDLATAAGFAGPSISRMLDGLAADGFVHRERSESDRRVTTLALTDKGLEIVERRRRFWGDRWRRALGGCDSGDLQAATKVLERIALVFDDPDEPIRPSRG